MNVKSDRARPVIPNYRSLDLDACQQWNRKGLSAIASGTKLRNGIRGTFPLLALVLGMFAAFTAAAGQAPAPEAASPAQQAPHRYRRVTLDDQVKGLAKNLDLDESQQAAVKKILEQRQQEILRITHAFSGSDRLSQLRALQVRTVEQIRAVLNDDQKKKYDPLGHHPPQQASPQLSVEDWLKATTPH